MNDATTPSPDEESDLPATYQLGEHGWEEIEYVEPGADWRVTEDGSYESPDGQTRTRPTAEPLEWSDNPAG